MDALLIVVAVAVVVLLLGGLALVLTRSTRSSRGGVEHPDSDKRRGNPPFESIERHRS
jgi:hypothetical protein